MSGAAGLLGLVVLVAAIAVVYWWCTSFVFMMGLSDSQLPGRYDKILWFVVFFTLWIFAPVVFSMWRKAHLESKQS